MPKVLRPNQILALLKRGLEVNPKSVTRNAIQENLILAAILPQIHLTLYEVLDAFIDL